MTTNSTKNKSIDFLIGLCLWVYTANIGIYLRNQNLISSTVKFFDKPLVTRESNYFKSMKINYENYQHNK